MKYLFLISMLFFAFSPQGLCSDDLCCKEKSHEQQMHDQESDEGAKSCSSSEKDHHSNETSHTSAHDCDYCMANITIIFNDIEETEIPVNTSAIDTGAKKLTSRFSFSIWIPPIKAA